MTGTITDQAAAFGWAWLALAVIASPLIVYGFGRATQRWTRAATWLLWALVVAAGVYWLAAAGRHDLPGVVAAFALAVGLFAEEIVPRLGRGLRSLWGAVVKRGSGGGGLPPAAGGPG